MSFWITQEYYITMGTLNPLTEYLGGHMGFDTREEAEIYRTEFNADPERAVDLDFYGEVCVNPHYNVTHYGVKTS